MYEGVDAEATYSLYSGVQQGAKGAAGMVAAGSAADTRSGIVRIGPAATGLRAWRLWLPHAHTRCAQNEGRGPDQVMRSGTTSLLLGKAIS